MSRSPSRRLLASEAGPARSRATAARPPRPGRAHGDRARVASRVGLAARLALAGAACKRSAREDELQATFFPCLVPFGSATSV